MPRLPLFLVLLFVLAPVALAAEIPLTDARVIPGHLDLTRHTPKTAGGDDGFLVVWQEDYSWPNAGLVKVRAYDAEGRAYEPVARVVEGTRSAQAVWTGDEYLLFSSETFGRWGHLPHLFPAVRVARLQRDGSPLDVPHSAYLPATTTSAILSVAWNGSNALAVVDSGGRHLLVVDRTGAFVSDTRVSSDIVAAAPDGDGFFLLRSSQGRDVAAGAGRFAVMTHTSVDIMDRNGTVYEQVPIGHVLHSIAYDGSEWLTAFLDEEGRVCTASFTGPDDIRRSCRNSASAAAPSVAAASGRSFVAWEQPGEQQIMTDGGLASTWFAPQRNVVSAIDATGLLVAWSEEDGIVRVGGLKHDGTRREEHLFHDAYAPRLASMPEGSLLVWTFFEDNGDRSVQAMRLDASGSPLAPVIKLGRGCVASVSSNDCGASVASNGDGWLVVQPVHTRIHDSDVERIRTTHITRGGFVAGVQERLAYIPQRAPVVAGIPGGFIVAWFENSTEVEGRWLPDRIVAQRVNRFGLPVSAEVVLGEGQYPVLACSSEECLVTWHRMKDFMAAGARFDHNLNRTSEERTFGPLPNTSVPRIVKAEGDDFRVFLDQEYEMGGVEMFRGRTVWIFTRDGRIYMRGLPSKVRAVRR